MSKRRMALTAGAVGAAAGCLGTWFEMSHAVVCVPVVTLPPLGLSHHLAIGNTVFGVAARQIIAATLYFAEPSTNVTVDDLAEIIDLKAAAVLSASGTVAALGASAFSARLAPRALRKTNGIFLVALALFLQWRDLKIRTAQEEREKQEGLEAEQPAAEMAAQPAEQPLADWKPPAFSAGGGDMRLLLLGSASGLIL